MTFEEAVTEFKEAWWAFWYAVMDVAVDGWWLCWYTVRDRLRGKR